MNKLQENKDLIVRYFNAISGVDKTDEICDTYMTDQKLKEHIQFFDTIFPKYELFADEMTAEADRVSIRARVSGVHEGDFNGIPPTHKHIEIPFAISYTIKDGIITDHWMIADQMSMMEQLGLMGKESAANHWGIASIQHKIAPPYKMMEHNYIRIGGAASTFVRIIYALKMFNYVNQTTDQNCGNTARRI